VLIEHGFIKGQGGENDVVIIAGTGAQSAKETKVLCEDAAEVGAQFVLVLTPSVWPPLMTRDNIIKFHRKIADASPVPTMIYNFPTVTAGLDLDSSIIAQLAQHPNIVGTKLSCGNIGKLHRLTTTPHITPSTFAVFPGRSDVFLQGLLSGSSGAICALPNLFPCVHVKLWKLWKEGKMDEAMKIQGLLAHGDWAMSKIGGVSGVKGAISQWFGYGTPTVRSPLTPADPAKLKSEEAGPLEKLLEMERALEEASKQ
jgi:dihydrodipicolinate synthase/N-acetylneuraminate lyase